MLFSVNCDRGRFIPRCHALGVRGKGVWKGPVVVVWIDAVRRIIISIANVASKVAHLRINLATTEPHGRSQGASSELRESRRQRRGLFAGLQTRLNAERAPERPQQQRSCARESEPRHGACGFSNAVVHRTRPFVQLAVSRSRLYHFRPLPRFALRFLSNRSGLPFARCCLPVVAKETSITFTCTTPQDKGRPPRHLKTREGLLGERSGYQNHVLASVTARNVVQQRLRVASATRKRATSSCKKNAFQSSRIVACRAARGPSAWPLHMPLRVTCSSTECLDSTWSCPVSDGTALGRVSSWELAARLPPTWRRRFRSRLRTTKCRFVGASFSL